MPRGAAFFHWLNRETGLQSMREYGNRDIYLILITRFLRMFAYGGAALVLAIFLYTEAGVSWKQTGTFMTLTLLGDAAISYILTIVADKVGRRRVLLIGSFLMTFSGTVFTFSKNYYVLLLAAVFGVISPGAHEVGPFRAVEVCFPAPTFSFHLQPCTSNRSPTGRHPCATSAARSSYGYLRLVCCVFNTCHGMRAVCDWLDHLRSTNLAED